MTFSLWYLLLPYALVVLGTGIFAFFNLYHIAKFGVQAASTTIILGLYTVSYTVVLIGSLVLLSNYQWGEMTTLGDIIPFFGNGTVGSDL